MPLKANLHFHSNEDPEDTLDYNLYQITDEAARLGFSVLGWACHNGVVYEPKYGEYAAGKGILLIPGIEKDIEERHTVILNCDKSAEKINTFAELREYKKANPQIFVLAPHPFFPSSYALQEKLEKNIDIFDAIELSWYHINGIDFNKKAEKMAEKYGKPFIATSDTHNLNYLDTGYALIDAVKDIPSVIEAIKARKFTNVSPPISFWDALLFQMTFFAYTPAFIRKIRKKYFQKTYKNP